MKDRAAAVVHEPSQAGSSGASYGRPEEIEDASNRILVHPLADRVARAAIARGVSANAVSLTGLACGFLAAVLYALPPQPLAVFAAFLFMVAWHVLDGADGKVARATGTASAFGRILDGICDHLVFGAVYLALVGQMVAAGTSIWILALAVTAALSHGLQAAAYEERRQKYQRRRAGRSREAVHRKLLYIKGRRSLLASLYDHGQRLLSGGDHGLDAALALLPEETRREVVDRTAPMVRAWGLLNANNRTLLIALMALVGEPAFYFLIVVTLFNLIMLALMLAERPLERQLAGQARDAAGGKL